MHFVLLIFFQTQQHIDVIKARSETSFHNSIVIRQVYTPFGNVDSH